jgi:hypothetical protein
MWESILSFVKFILLTMARIIVELVILLTTLGVCTDETLAQEASIFSEWIRDLSG